MIDETHLDPKVVELEASISRQIGGMGTHLHVRVKDGSVTLSGSAEDFEEKRRIDTVVKGLAGGHKVVNEIRVISTEDSFDNNR
jgi:osmotically-inducible protein OsmY